MNEIMESLSRFMQKGSLSKYISLPEKLQIILVTVFIIFAIVMALVYGFLLITKSDIYYEERNRYLFHRIIMMVLSLSIIFIHMVCPKAVESTFIVSLPRFWVYVGWGLLMALVAGQVEMMFRLLRMNDGYADRGSSYRVTLLGLFLFLGVLILSLLFKGLHNYLYWIGFGTIALQILVDAYFTIINRSSFLSFLRNSIWFLVCMTALMIWGELSITIFVIAFFWYVLISGLLSSGNKPSCCGTCRTYDGGYCHYRGEYVSSSDRCDKWES